MIAIEEKTKYYTPEEYLTLEEAAESKSEYHDGEIIPITGRTTNHNKIIGNFYFQLRLALRNKNYEIYINDVRLWIPEWKRYLYPDIMIIEGQPLYQGENTTTIINPSIIIEVLSNSTKDYDRGDKFKYYRSINSLKEYILIDQYSYYLEQFSKQSENEWLFKTYSGEEQILALSSIDFQIVFSDIYEQILFETI